MADPSRPSCVPIVVALLGVPDATAATLYGYYDTFASTCRDWQMVHGCRAESPFRPMVASRDGRPFTAANGIRITPDASFAAMPAPGIVCVTDLAIPPGEPLDDRYDVEAQWLRERHADGAIVTSSCSGAVLLAHAGLLDGLDATTHWAYCDALRRQYPRTRWHPERGLVVSGADQRIVMAGSGIAWHQLVLSLIARHAGAEAAMQVARINLMDWNTTSPIAYASLRHGAQASDPVVAHCQEWAALHYQTESPVARMVALSGLPERTFKRRFAQATGMSPLEYVHTLRLEEAKQMLEAGDEPVEMIALEVGYQDASFFSRLFRRRVALTPAQYRRRFGGLKRRLDGAAAPVAPRDARGREATR
ncbi:MAG: helix-turn-helix domain-containing protein [Burkholderiaceae bacterium]|nr:helix-turn-helix domain-containing protein [Burkholderiaceae bacterium]